MAKKKKTAYWLLPAAALCLTCAVMSVGQSQARYVNSTTWHTVAEPTRLTVTSNYLEQTNQPPLTILLGQMDLDSREASFVLDSTAGVSGALTWTVDKPEYLDVAVKIGEIPLSSGDTVSLEGENPVTVTMTLTPTAQAAEPRPAMDVNIQVAWSDALAGTFRAELSAVENVPVAYTEPETTESETTEPEVIDSQISVVDVPQEDETQPETTAPENTEPEITEPQPGITLEAFATYHPDLMFPLHLSSNTDRHISLNLLSDQSIQNFPQGTRFSLDKGASWFMLYNEGEIPVDVPSGEPLMVMLDLSATTLGTDPSLSITAGENTSVTLTAATEPIYWMNSQVLTKDTEIILTFADLWQDCELICSVDMLVSTENGKEYVPAEITPSGLMAEISQKDNKQQLTIRIGDTLPQPGTYRINLSWRYNGICIWQNRTGFFINYTGNTITKTGGDRQ